MFQLILENVRTFAGRVTVPIRPLTVLIGENSSGKSTFLAALSAVADEDRFPFSPGFNRPPYNLGSFETIATYKGGKYGRAKTFAIGYEIEDERSFGKRARNHRALATFRNRSGQPSLSRFELTSGRGNATLVVDEGEHSTGRIELELAGKTHSSSYELRRPLGEWAPRSFADLLLSATTRRRLADDERTLELLRDIHALGATFGPPRSLSIAPIRSKPERTYGQISELFEPAGDHVPFLLERMVQERPDSPETIAVLSALETFGSESGLFKKIDVRKLGNKPDDPFQLLVTMEGRAANLIDVGYGVSQALPVIVQSVLATPDTRVLLQQPEVHLHPRAQAALGSFFAKLVAGSRKHFVMETHSDFIIDRVRQHVAEGTIAPQDVSLLFFERRKSETTIHQLELDSIGNITNPPPCYREFFVQEEWRLLARGAMD